MFHKVLVSAFVAFVAVLIMVVAPVRAEGCELEYQEKEGINFLSMVLDCPPTEEGYYAFQFGDGDFFDVWLDANGNSAEFVHAYPYVESGVITHTASINSDGFNDPDYFFAVVIDDRADFFVGEVNFQNTMWDWPYEIRRDGVFTFTVNTSCNGLAGNHFAKFQWEIEGPAQGSMFGNWVEPQFVTQALVTTTLVVSDVSGVWVWSQEILAPTCEVPKPQIIVGDGPFFAGDIVTATVVAPNGAEFLSIGTDQLFSEYSQECYPTDGGAPVRSLSCSPGTRVIEMQIGQEAKVFELSAKVWFDTPVVDSGVEITRSVTPDDIVADVPSCNLTVASGSGFNQKTFQFSWDHAVSVHLDFGDDATVGFDPQLGESDTSHNYGWDTSTGSSVYTATLTVKGVDDMQEICEVEVTITDPNFQEPKPKLRLHLPVATKSSFISN